MVRTDIEDFSLESTQAFPWRLNLRPPTERVSGASSELERVPADLRASGNSPTFRPPASATSAVGCACFESSCLFAVAGLLAAARLLSSSRALAKSPDGTPSAFLNLSNDSLRRGPPGMAPGVCCARSRSERYVSTGAGAYDGDDCARGASSARAAP